MSPKGLGHQARRHPAEYRGSFPGLGKGRPVHPVLLIDKFPVQAEALGPGKWTWEPETPRTGQFGLDRFGPVGVSGVKPIPCGWHATPAPCPIVNRTLHSQG